MQKIDKQRMSAYSGYGFTMPAKHFTLQHIFLCKYPVHKVTAEKQEQPWKQGKIVRGKKVLHGKTNKSTKQILVKLIRQSAQFNALKP